MKRKLGRKESEGQVCLNLKIKGLIWTKKVIDQSKRRAHVKHRWTAAEEGAC